MLYYIVTAVNSANTSNMVTLQRRQTTAEFSNLRIATSYNISVAAVNRVGIGASSVIIQSTLNSSEEGM